MEDIFQRKQDIEEKLLQEKKKYDLIKENLKTADNLTNNMVTILNQFDERLHKLEDTILPVHRKTKDLQRLQDNIEKTLSALDHVIGYHHVAQRIEPMLIQGPSRQVEGYLKAMESLYQAVVFFSENNPDSPELNKVNGLFESGKESLDKEFKTLLSRQTRPMLPNKLIEIISVKESEIQSQLPENTIYDLSLIAKWLTGPGKTQGFMTTYADIRSTNLIRTLTSLKDYIKGLSPGNNSRKLSSVIITPKKSGNRRPSNFSRKASTLLRKESLQSISVGGLGRSSHLPIPEEEIIELDLDPFMKMLSACIRLISTEMATMQSIIGDKNKKRVFNEIISAPLDLLAAEGQKFVQYAKQCITRHDHPSVANLFPAIKHLKETLPEYNELSRMVSDVNQLKLPRLIEELDSVGVEVLQDFTDCVKRDPEKESNMPKDGTVHELTSNAILFMQQLAQNVDTAGGMLAAQQMEVQPPKSKVKECLAEYVVQVLGALKLNLENKSRVYPDTYLASVFLLNNYCFILNALYRYDLLDLVQQITSDVEKIYQTIIENQKSKYLNSWDKFAAYLSDESKGVVVSTQPGIKLKEKEKQIVKDKFKSFNNDFEEIIKLHSQWAMPNTDIRKEIKNSVKEKIVEPYNEFLKRYRMVQFTKNMDKYLKFNPDKIEENISHIFSQSSGPINF